MPLDVKPSTSSEQSTPTEKSASSEQSTPSTHSTHCLETHSISRLLWSFCVPAMIGTFVQGVSHIIAGIFLGQYLGKEALAAIQFATPFLMITVACGMLVCLGAVSLVSLRLGQKDHDGAEEVMGNAFVMMTVISSVVVVLLLSMLIPLLRWSGAEGTVLEMAWVYTFICVGTSVFSNLGFGFNNIIRAEGHPREAMRPLIVVAAANIFLIWLFIAEFGWGMAGAAWATAGSQFVLMVWVMTFFFTEKSGLKFRRRFLKLRWRRTVWPMLGIGTAPCTMQVTACLQAYVLNYQLSQYGGQDAVSVMGVVIRTSLLVFYILTGLSQGAQPIIGFNYGARQYHRVRQTLLGAVIAATALASMGFIVIECFPVQVLRIFTRDITPELLAMGIPALQLCLLLMPTSGYQIFTVSYYQAIGRPKMSICLTIMRRIGFLIPLLMTLPMWLGLHGIWLSYSIADGIAALVIAMILFSEYRRLTRLHDSPPPKEPDRTTLEASEPVSYPEDIY